MNHRYRWVLPRMLAFVVTLGLASCAGGSGAHEEGEGEHREGREGGEHAEEGEHGGEGGHDEEGEESGVYVSASETWDVVRRGARLVLAFDSGSNAFVGTVENTTEGRLCAIRVEVHLSTGTELGPTDRVDLPAGVTVVAPALLRS